MPKHKVRTREEWSAARKALLEREQEVAGVDVVYHTYARTAPDRFLLAPYYYQLLDQIPNGRDADSRYAATTSTRYNEKHGVRHLPGSRHAAPQA
jgi:predicted dithiol-disulfide oxidoreductase (DUF899 family)